MVVSVTIRFFIGEAFEGIDPQRSSENQERKEQI
tara:strand:+ start:573 stop:674 length:102 start_codon:yes stop_codon:yes gene_type:complete